MAESFRSSTTPPEFLTIPDAAPLVPCAPASLADPAFRARLGVPFFKIGGRVLFSAEDIVRWREGCRVEQVSA